MILSELELPLGQDHPLGHLAPELAALEHEPVRELGAGQCDRDGRARSEVPRPADDLVGVALPHVDDTELEPIRVRVLPGAEHLPGAEEAEVPAVVRYSPVLDRRDDRTRDVDPLGEVVERHLEPNVIAEPGERDAHRTRTASSRGGRSPRTA